MYPETPLEANVDTGVSAENARTPAIAAAGINFRISDLLMRDEAITRFIGEPP